jgi:hypothetical protein
MTSLDVVNILYAYIKSSILKTGPKKVNGGLYKFKRPIGSAKEDIIINSLPLNDEQLQEGVFNINIFVPNQSLNLAGTDVTDNSLPNTDRLTELIRMAKQVLSSIDDQSGEYSFNLQQENIIEDTNNQHYINLRLEFYSINF